MKKYIFSVIFILMSLIIILLPKDNITKKYEIEYEMIDYKEYIYVYYVDNGKLIGIPIEVTNNDKFILIETVFKYLTEKSNSVIYETYLEVNSKLTSYEIRGDNIYLEVNDIFLDLKDKKTLLGLSQILYSYKELGYKEVFILNDGKIIEQMHNVVLYHGLNELPVNLLNNTTSINTKVIKITYYYKNNTKSFVNYIVDYNEDESTVVLSKLIEFINSEYNINLKLIDFNKYNYVMSLRLSCEEKDVLIVKKIISDNLNIEKENIIIE